MSNIKAIETLYNGYRFRSRLEARWAVFFDTLGVEYKYEPEGFDLGGCVLLDHFGENIIEYTLGDDHWYLPDFYLPGQQCWIEIKPMADFGDSISKPSLFARCQEKDVFIFMGDPYRGAATYLWVTHNDSGILSEYPFLKSSAFTDDAFFGFMHTHYPQEVFAPFLETRTKPPKDDYACYVFDSCGGNPAILSEYQVVLTRAYEAARQARFGKNGRG